MLGFCALFLTVPRFLSLRLRRPAIIAGVVLLGILCVECHAQDRNTIRRRERIERTLLTQLRFDSANASSWRLLGRVQLELDKLEKASESLTRAVSLDRLNAAAHYDLGRVFIRLGREQDAIAEFQSVMEIAGESLYADKARDHLLEFGAEPPEEIVQAGFEVRQFGGLERLPNDQNDKLQPPSSDPSNLYIRLESGVLYNSNVALSPISRNLFPGTRDSVQAFVAPTIDYQIVSRENVTAGASFAGDFNINEGDFREFNLQSYRPALYVERVVFGPLGILVPRIQYEFAHDAFEGTPFGNRHAVTASLANFWDCGGTSFVYWASDYTDFVTDGILPSVTSRDGLTHAAGFSHTFDIERRHLETVTAGVDLKRANIEGTDSAFDGVSLFTEMRMPIVEDLLLTVRGGWGFRDYRLFEFEPSRNENVWQVGAELRKRFNEHVSIAFVIDYDYFDSKNVLFAAERYVGGVVLRFEN
jgi:hypothetical protein